MIESNENGIWKAVGASVKGAGHARTALPCQDIHAWRRVHADWMVIAVADGVGSEPLSDIGARRAVDCAVAELAERVERHLDGLAPLADADAWQGALRQVLAASRIAVEREATVRERPASELASTLLLAVLGPTMTAAAQIGDGAIIVHEEDGAIASVTRPDCGEYINEVTCLISPDAVETAQCMHFPRPVRSAAVFTDGIQMLTLRLPKWDPFVPFFEPVFSYFQREADPAAAQAELERMLMSPGVRDRTEDDVTLVVASRLSPVDAGAAEASSEQLASADA